jgi:hypothetical protein
LNRSNQHASELSPGGGQWQRRWSERGEGSGGLVTGVDERRGKEGGLCCSRGREWKRTGRERRGRGHCDRRLLKRWWGEVGEG